MLSQTAPIPGESTTDFHRFCIYRDLGPRRSLSEAARRCELSESRLKQLSAQYRWSQRARLWDLISKRERQARPLSEETASREALLQEALGLQDWVRAEVSQWVRRGPEGRPELAQGLSFGQAFGVWAAALDTEQRLMRYAQPHRAAPDPSGGFSNDIARAVGIFIDEITEQMITLGAERARAGRVGHLVLVALRNAICAAPADPVAREGAGTGAPALDP